VTNVPGTFSVGEEAPATPVRVPLCTGSRLDPGGDGDRFRAPVGELALAAALTASSSAATFGLTLHVERLPPGTDNTFNFTCVRSGVIMGVGGGCHPALAQSKGEHHG